MGAASRRRAARNDAWSFRSGRCVATARGHAKPCQLEGRASGEARRGGAVLISRACRGRGWSLRVLERGLRAWWWSCFGACAGLADAIAFALGVVLAARSGRGCRGEVATRRRRCFLLGRCVRAPARLTVV